MDFQLKKTITRCTVFVALVPSLAALAAQDGAGKLDPDTAPKRGQYVYDSFGHNTRAGLTERCVDTGFWDPATATVACDPNLFAARSAPKPQTAAAEKPAAKSVAASAPGAPGAYVAHENQAASATQRNAGVAAAHQTSAASASPAKATPAALSSTSRPVAQAAAASNAAPANSASTAGKAWSESVVPVPLAAAPAGNGVSSPAQSPDRDQTPARDDGILAEHRYQDDAGSAAKDDGILGSSRYDNEYPGTAREDGTSALSQDHDGNGGAAREDGIIAHSVYGNDDSGVASESLLSQPKVLPQGDDIAVAAADKPQAITMLPVTITVEADPLFDFDQAAVRDDSRKKLDDLIQQLRGVNYGDVIVVGFADPIGTAIYNQSLSWRRAESVEQYLAKHGLPASRMRAEGRGETEEFATFESCGGIRNERAIACLQPDRRVEVTITAKRQP
ncbi:MAG TPA: OmpA family protein [Burkholderiales bacterium]|nr:OmpA family protein [Burkholderiales bacterium]